MKENNKEKKTIYLMPKSPLLIVAMIAVIVFQIIFLMLISLVDVFPGRYVAAALAIVIAMDVVSFLMLSSRKEKTKKRGIGLILSIILILSTGTGSYYLYNTYETICKVTGVEKNVNDFDVTIEPFNFLISGIDSRDDINDDFARSDVNMIVTVNPKTFTVLLTSMPRDSYVPLHMNGEMDKLTHTGVYGIKETVATIEDWLDIKIDYYARVDFHMLENLVDAVGGIKVYNDIDFISHPKGWHYKKGWHNMNGKFALWFVRERKSFEDEDEQRIRNQQKVVKALISKISSSKTLMMNYTEILNAVEGNMQTSMSNRDISGLAKLQLLKKPEWNIKRQWVDGDDSEAGTWSMGPNRLLFVSIPKPESVEKVSKNINSVMHSNDVTEK